MEDVYNGLSGRVVEEAIASTLGSNYEEEDDFDSTFSTTTQILGQRQALISEVFQTIRKYKELAQTKHFVYSDQKVAEDLNQRGFKIARRTVSKLRDENFNPLSTGGRPPLISEASFRLVHAQLVEKQRKGETLTCRKASELIRELVLLEQSQASNFGKTSKLGATAGDPRFWARACKRYGLDSFISTTTKQTDKVRYDANKVSILFNHCNGISSILLAFRDPDAPVDVPPGFVLSSRVKFADETSNGRRKGEQGHDRHLSTGVVPLQAAETTIHHITSFTAFGGDGLVTRNQFILGGGRPIGNLHDLAQLKDFDVVYNDNGSSEQGSADGSGSFTLFAEALVKAKKKDLNEKSWLLFLDGSRTHFCPEANRLLLEADIHYVKSSPNTTQFLQPSDDESLHGNLARERMSLFTDEPEIAKSLHLFLSVLEQLVMRTFVRKNIQNAIRRTGWSYYKASDGKEYMGIDSAFIDTFADKLVTEGKLVDDMSSESEFSTRLHEFLSNVAAQAAGELPPGVSLLPQADMTQLLLGLFNNKCHQLAPERMSFQEYCDSGTKSGTYIVNTEVAVAGMLTKRRLKIQAEVEKQARMDTKAAKNQTKAVLETEGEARLGNLRKSFPDVNDTEWAKLTAWGHFARGAKARRRQKA